jgi:hypothetical protein
MFIRLMFNANGAAFAIRPNAKCPQTGGATNWSTTSGEVAYALLSNAALCPGRSRGIYAVLAAPS